MTIFLRHEPCPNCGSKDNLGVWSDGHKFCFGCHYYEHGGKSLNVEEIKTRIIVDDKNNKNNISLPDDFDYYIPDEPRAWLNKYELTPAEITRARIGYSQITSLLIFPIFSERGELIAWQGRDFKPVKKSKYFTRGVLEDVLHLQGNGPAVVLTEDIISAIKVARVGVSMPIFGSHLASKNIVRLSRYFDHLIIWLDRDKAKESHKTANRARPFFKTVESIVTDKDPKEYSTGEIRKILNYDRFNNPKTTT